ncbi:hypothetical protein [Nocardia sp. NPDC049526]|uniref:hypothetical protein n=1 Tax=Nocardia sp. NPDC049526 TaxID=3364316 RepID=UPI0037B5A179
MPQPDSRPTTDGPIGFDPLAMIEIRTSTGHGKQVCAELAETSHLILTTGRYEVMAEGHLP